MKEENQTKSYQVDYHRNVNEEKAIKLFSEGFIDEVYQIITPEGTWHKNELEGEIEVKLIKN